jgi:hypothetical protein
MLDCARSIPAEQQQRHQALRTARAGAVSGGQQTRDPDLTNAHRTTSWSGSESENKESGMASVATWRHRKNREGLVFDFLTLKSRPGRTSVIAMREFGPKCPGPAQTQYCCPCCPSNQFNQRRKRSTSGNPQSTHVIQPAFGNTNNRKTK